MNEYFILCITTGRFHERDVELTPVGLECRRFFLYKIICTFNDLLRWKFDNIWYCIVKKHKNFIN